MEEYEKIESDMFDTFDMSDVLNATTTNRRQENGVTSQNQQIIRQLDMGLEKKLVGNPRVFKATNRNVVKQLKMWQKMQAIT